MSSHDPTLQTVLRQLNSDKIKERQDAVSKIREHFARDSLISSLDPTDWTVIFVNLQASFAKELSICTKKGTLATTGPGATALKRLEEVASTVRWLTGRTIHLLRFKTVKSLLTHLTRDLKYRGRLLEPVAVHYIKAIKTIVEWTPHLHSLELKDQDTWLRVVEMGFNVVLEDSLNKRLEDMDEGEEEEGVLRGAPSEEDLGSSSEGDASSVGTPQPTNSRKRRLPERKHTSRTPAPTARKTSEMRSVSQEQVAFASVLAIVLGSETAPLLSPEFPLLPVAVLDRLSRFLSQFPGESTLHHDYLHCLSSVLSQLSINRSKSVSAFAKRSWSDLVGIWGTKTQTLKEELVIVLRTLLPYLTTNLDHDRPTRVTYEEGVNKLWRVLMNEADKRGVEGLSLDCIRLQVLSAEEESKRGAFVAKTFRHGWHFDSGQALSWAILALQTDCAEKLYLLSESVHSTTNDSGKRVKRENPIESLLSSLSTSTSSIVRGYRLQGILFFIDAHWDVLHDDLRKSVISTLQYSLSLDDALVQSWTFLCLAAIGHAESTSQAASITPSQQLIAQDSTTWNNIWTHAMRRTSIPAVCRAACHAAHTLLHHAKLLLTPQQILMEIESLAKDLDMQGPSFPYDSACSFLVLCMQIASHDVRLYRMQLEEKVLTWLTDAWRPGSIVKTKMSAHTVEDILGVLGSICCTSRNARVLCPMKLPDCPVTSAMVEENYTAVIRDYLLNARLPQPPKHPYRRGHHSSQPIAPSTPVAEGEDSVSDNRELLQPRGRERRLSAFLLKSLEDLLQHWEIAVSGRPTADKLRSSMDLAVVSLLFEGTLVLNGTRSNRRVQQAACKLLTLLMPHANDNRWTPSERSLIVAALEPLILTEVPGNGLNHWETLLPAGPESGIQRELLPPADSRSHSNSGVAARRDLQKCVFHSHDVQEIVGPLSDVLHTMLKAMLSSSKEQIRDKDNFGSAGTPRIVDGNSTRQALLRTAARWDIANVCITSMAVLPILQSSSGAPTRDKRLLGTIGNFELEDWQKLGPAFIDNVRTQTLHLSVDNLLRILESIGDLLQGDSDAAQDTSNQLLVITLLEATMHIWLPGDSDLFSHVALLFSWLCNIFVKPAMASWACRDRFTQFLGSCMAADPSQTLLQGLDENGDEWVPAEIRPFTLLPTMGGDVDIRVRFRAAVVNVQLVRNATYLNAMPMAIYAEIRRYLNTDLEHDESIITRLLCLGNVMVASSAVRRGALWHILELCLYDGQKFTRHVETLLSGVASRLNLSTSALFLSYASHVAYALKTSGKEFLQLPAHLLGFRDKRECADATFAAFTPINVLAGGTAEEISHGRYLVKMHCQATKKTLAEGIKQCFAEIVGNQIVSFVQGHGPDEMEDLSEALADKTRDVQEDYDTLLRSHADSVVTAIIRSLSDSDYSQDGPLMNALEPYPPAAVHFQKLCKFRHLYHFESHDPNLPAFPAVTVLRSLDWFGHQVPSIKHHSTTYHVLHQLFAEARRASLVNEQLRLLTAVCLWAATHPDDFFDPTILRTFVNCAANTLSQLDLARTAQSLLDWAFSLYEKLKLEDNRLASTFIHIASTAYDFSTSSFPDVSALGQDLLRWAEEQATRLRKHSSLRRQVEQALSVWPVELAAPLQAKLSGDSSYNVISILNDGRVSANKFRLVQRLRDIPGHEGALALAGFWTLKACIPPKAHRSSTDLSAFCEYLVSHKGFADDLGTNQSKIQSVRTRHVKGLRKGGGASNGDKVPIAQQAIVASLLTILDEPSACQAQISYGTLRALVSVLPLDPESLLEWPREYRGELAFLKDYCRTAKARSQPDLRDLTTNSAWVDIASDFTPWITQIAPILSDILAVHAPFYTPLVSLLQVDASFAEEVFPVLVHTALQMEYLNNNVPRGKRIRDYLSVYFDRLLRTETTCVSSRRAIVDTVFHLRYFWPPSPKERDALGNDKWLDMDYILLSRNAITCGAYTTALLCLELAAEYNGLKGTTTDTEQIMYDIYSHIDEPDGFYGINTLDLQKFLVQRFHHEKQWDKAFQFHGARLEARASGSRDAEGVLQSLHAFGLDHLAMSTLHDANSGLTLDSSGMTYKLGWRTETWDLPERPEQRDVGASLYVALRSVYRERDPSVINTTLHRALVDEMEELSHLGTESVNDIRQVLQNLMCLHQVAQWQTVSAQSDLQHVDLRAMSRVDKDFDFHDLEAMMAVRVSLLRSALQKEQREQIGDMRTPLAETLMDVQTSCLLRLSQAAREANQPQIALNSVIKAQQLSAQDNLDVSEELSEVLWLQREPKLSVQYLRKLLGDKLGVDSAGDMRTASALARLGRWTSEASLEKSADIKSAYFDPAAKFVDSNPSPSQSQSTERAAIYHQYALFAEHQYHSIAKSPDALRWKFYVERKRQELIRRQEELKKHSRGSEPHKLISMEIKRTDQVLREDQRQFQEHIDSRDAFLVKAIEMYSRTLQVSDDFDDDSAIRLCSLWFSNFEYEGGDFQRVLGEALRRVSSHKFVFLAHQLTARMSDKPSSTDNFDQENLQELVMRMCREHPFHSLTQVWCLQSDHKLSSRRQSNRAENPSSQVARANAAGSIFDKLRNEGDFGTCIRNVEEVCHASLEWATYPIKGKHKHDKSRPSRPIPEGLAIRKIRDVRMPVITVNTPIDPTTRYDRCTWIQSYEHSYSVAGGVNLPKITKCIGSDGNTYKQLFKGEGNDDLRQDAVMEQVFRLVNIILGRDRETRKRKLSVRDYMVIPLSSQAGVLEFVTDTQCLRDFLEPGHSRYHPHEMYGPKITTELREKRDAIKNDPGVQKMMLEIFLGYTSKFHPVMRHWFREMHKTPMSWFKMRLAYSRSVATNSIVGHILGLGDRHTSNILLDNSTGEVVHIDLGIAFDQGKMLPIPERVPFRLTRDMVDGLGTSGTQGVFQRCAEETLRVLRAGSGVIVTVLEVFKYDPLHSWTASEIKVKRVQGTGDTGLLTEEAVRYALGIDMTSGSLADENADRALSAVSRKLDKTMTVEFTVNELIAEATDVMNLANMFAGWGPHY
ncbi:hypothetical protein BXZ70DRAFT_923785 [Cristinia sonorae]|uniref:Serine/threonine-protein kinase Tel1 n=1 Tax=Cristinia sonorae TaxID=1940300 RepID=A0A8K0XT64_9AGAR|nr:hypothetical protein BXZ70DRAFT_923785 [Cristinia sonorae]